MIVLKIEGIKNINSMKKWQVKGFLGNYCYSPDADLAIHFKSLALCAISSSYILTKKFLCRGKS